MFYEKPATNHETVLRFIRENWRSSFHEADGVLKHKFLDPAAGYRGQLWDWDSYFCALGLMDVFDDTADYALGCVQNFADYMAPDGFVPYVICAHPTESSRSVLPPADRSPRGADADYNAAKPLLAQMTEIACKKEVSVTELVKIYAFLKAYIAHWENTQKAANGLFVWRSYRGSGTDNHPAIYGRPLNSSAGVELNCFMFKEYKAMENIANRCGLHAEAVLHKEKAETLKDAVNAHMWDEIDGLYYHLDMLNQKPVRAKQEITWDVPLKFKCWTCFMPMWAGIAPKERAERMVREHLLNENEFWSDFGIRTLAKNEPMYSTTEMSNPSNWQGPIWIVSTYLVFKGVLNYGYTAEAQRIAENLLDLLANDIQKNGVLHEYYNPETGDSTMSPGFMNWNALAGVMLPELEKEMKK